MHEASDEAILEYTALQDRIVVTLDRDFPQLLVLASATRPSVVLIRQERLRGHIAAVLVNDVCRRYENELSVGCVIKVGVRGTRIRLLPLK